MKKNTAKILYPFILLVLFYSSAIVAQFNAVVPMLPAEDALVFTTDGRQVQGKVVASSILNGQLKSFTIKDEAGTKHPFKAAEVSEIRAKLTKFAKLAEVTDAIKNNDDVISQVKAIVNATKSDVWKKELVIYYQVELSPGKFSLLQLLNPGTNTIISVYPAPNMQEGGEQLYYAVKGDQITKIVSKDYAKETYGALFGDCEAYISKYPVDKKLKMADFPTHVMEYNAACAK